MAIKRKIDINEQMDQTEESIKAFTSILSIWFKKDHRKELVLYKSFEVCPRPQQKTENKVEVEIIAVEQIGKEFVFKTCDQTFKMSDFSNEICCEILEEAVNEMAGKQVENNRVKISEYWVTTYFENQPKRSDD